MALFDMCVVDSFLLAQHCQGARCWLSANDFIVALADIITKNTCEKRVLQKQEARAVVNDGHFETLSGVFKASKQLCAPTPIKRPKKCNTKHRAQGKARQGMACKRFTSHGC